MPVAIPPPGQHRGRRLAVDLTGLGSHEAGGEADPRAVRRVRVRAVDDVDVMERHLAGPQDDVDGILLVDLHLDLLSPAQAVVRGVCVPVREDRPPVRARHHSHAAVVESAVGQGDPCGHDPGRVQAPVGAVLVPRDEPRIARVLGEDGHGPHEDVRPQQVLDGIEDPRVGGEIVSPAEVRLRVAERLGHGPPAEPGGHLLEGGPEARRLPGGEDRHGEEDPVPLVLLDLRCRQELAHVVLLTRTGR